MGRKLQAEQRGVFPHFDPNRYVERDRVVSRALAQLAGLPSREELPPEYRNLGNPDLPVANSKEEIQRIIRDNQISMLEGATGSGKSTQLPQYALEMGYLKIVQFVPRTLLADNLADRVEYELDEQLGIGLGSSIVGVRHSRRSTGRGKQVEIMTPDTFIRLADELDEFADMPVLFVGDEIHEKGFGTELAVAVVVKKLQQNPKWRLVLASATLDSDPIRTAYSGVLGKEVPCVSVEGRPFNLEIIEEPELTPEEAYLKYGPSHQKAQIFVAGKREIRDTTDGLAAHRLRNTRITPLHSRLSRADIKKATSANLREDQKQIIPSTNAGQSGITIAGQTLVISDGTIRRNYLDENGTAGLFKVNCARDEMIQQGGRAGRDVAGGLMVITKPDDPEFSFVGLDDREPFAPAEIYQTNISGNVLATTALGYNFYDLNALLINKVDDNVILEAYEVLYRLGAIDEKNRITDIGKSMTRFPLRPELGRSLHEALSQNAPRHVVQQLIATLSAVGAGGLPYFEKGVGEKWRDDIREESDNDYLAQLDMFMATREFYFGDYVDEYALQERNYDLQNTLKAHQTYDKICERLGYKRPADLIVPTPTESAQMRQYLAAGLFDYTHRRVAPDDESRNPTYVGVRDRETRDRRELSSRGIYKGKDRYVLGFPRRFEKHGKNGLEVHTVIEDVAPTTIRTLARHALPLAERVPQPPRVENGQLVRSDMLMFGDLELGEAPSLSTIVHTEETRRILREAAFDKPTQALKELISIKRELEWLMRRVPNDEVEAYFPQGTLTDELIVDRIEAATNDNVDNIYLLDNGLRAFMIREGISIATWISPDNEKQIRDRSPETVTLANGQTYDLYYTHGQPIINGFNLRDAAALPEQLLLEDGREIFINYKIGHDTKRHSASEIRVHAQVVA